MTTLDLSTWEILESSPCWSLLRFTMNTNQYILPFTLFICNITSHMFTECLLLWCRLSRKQSILMRPSILKRTLQMTLTWGNQISPRQKNFWIGSRRSRCEKGFRWWLPISGNGFWTRRTDHNFCLYNMKKKPIRVPINLNLFMHSISSTHCQRLIFSGTQAMFFISIVPSRSAMIQYVYIYIYI